MEKLLREGERLDEVNFRLQLIQKINSVFKKILGIALNFVKIYVRMFVSVIKGDIL